MFVLKYLLSACLLSMLIMSSALAHDASEHRKTAEQPQCEALKNMDEKQRNSKDPVIRAMMKKCQSYFDAQQGDEAEGHLNRGNDHHSDPDHGDHMDEDHHNHMSGGHD